MRGKLGTQILPFATQGMCSDANIHVAHQEGWLIPRSLSARAGPSRALQKAKDQVQPLLGVQMLMLRHPRGQPGKSCGL